MQILASSVATIDSLELASSAAAQRAMRLKAAVSSVTDNDSLWQRRPPSHQGDLNSGDSKSGQYFWYWKSEYIKIVDFYIEKGFKVFLV